MVRLARKGEGFILLAIVLAIQSILVTGPAGASAETSGNCGEGMTWTLNDAGKLTITGNGEVCRGAWDDSLVKEIEIGDGATAICEGTFSSCENLRKVRIPESVTTIGSLAFACCKALTGIELPGKLVSIDSVAFADTGLKELRIPESVTSLGYNIISGCEYLRYVEVRGKDVSLEGAFSKEREYVWEDAYHADQAYVCAPAGSTTLARLKEQGVRCAAISGEITLNHPLSTDPNNPTPIPAADTTLDLSNAQGIVFQKTRGDYIRADLPRNRNMVDRYFEDYDVEGNRMAYEGDGRYFDTEAFQLIYEKDGEKVVTRPYYTVFGVAKLNEPAITEPYIPDALGEGCVLPYRDLKVSWIPTENAEYEVGLSSGPAGAVFLMEKWHSERLKDNTCVIPASVLLPGDTEYMIKVEAVSPETGERLDMRSHVFRIFANDAVTKAPKILRPFPTDCRSDDDRVLVTAYVKDLEVEWASVPNAVHYSVELNYEVTSGWYYTAFEKQTEETKMTIPEEIYKDLYASESVSYLWLRVVATDRYGSEQDDTVYFCFGDPSAMCAKVDGQAISFSRDAWTVLAPGSHTMTWDAVDGADSCIVELAEEDGIQSLVHLPITESNSLIFDMKENAQYILILNARKNGKVVNGGWYYMTTGRSTRETPEILKPTAEFLPRKEFAVSWTDTGAASYNISLGKFLETDSPLEFSLIDGSPEPYYSHITFEKKGTTGTETVVPADALDYNGMYRLLVIAVYEDGTECRAEAKFQVEGDPAARPEIEGADVSSDPLQPGINRMPEQIRIKWAAQEATVCYEAGLFTADETGERLELVTMLTSEEPEIILPGSALKGMMNYQLAVREYDRDGFSREYRIWFKTLGCLEHQSVSDPAKAPTCTEKGLTEGSHCPVCGAVLKTQEEIPATGHSGEWILDSQETLDGLLTKYYVRTCTVCGEQETREERVAIERLPGDANEDREVDGRDVIHLMRWLAEDAEIEINESNADVNQDDVVDELDLLLLIRYLAGMDVVLQ